MILSLRREIERERKESEERERERESYCCVITQYIDHCQNNSQLCNILMANNRNGEIIDGTSSAL